MYSQYMYFDKDFDWLFIIYKPDVWYNTSHGVVSSPANQSRVVACSSVSNNTPPFTPPYLCFDGRVPSVLLGVLNLCVV